MAPNTHLCPSLPAKEEEAGQRGVGGGVADPQKIHHQSEGRFGVSPPHSISRQATQTAASDMGSSRTQRLGGVPLGLSFCIQRMASHPRPPGISELSEATGEATPAHCFWSLPVVPREHSGGTRESECREAGTNAEGRVGRWALQQGH